MGYSGNRISSLHSLDLSRCFLKSWRLMRKDWGMGWMKSKFSSRSLWFRRKNGVPPRQLFLALFQAVFFSWSWTLIVEERMAGGWCIQRCLLDFYVVFLKRCLYGSHLTTKTTRTNLTQVETTKPPSDRWSLTFMDLSHDNAMFFIQTTFANWI